MVSVEPVETIIKTVLASGKLKDERPLSCIIIAPVECGKTSVIRKYCLKSENVFYTTDATAYGIIRDSNELQDFARDNGKITHIVIPDLLSCLGRKQDTVRTFVTFMNSLIEEGVVNISTYAVKLKTKPEINEVKAGFITAIPPDPFRDKRHSWTSIGFLSRALPVSFDYRISTRVEILNSIMNQEHLGQAVERLNLPKEEKSIVLPFDMAQKIQPYVAVLASASRSYGFRYQRQLQAFAKAIALLKDKEKVDMECIEELARLANYINLDGHMI